jgi:hypothetical protein
MFSLAFIRQVMKDNQGPADGHARGQLRLRSRCARARLLLRRDDRRHRREGHAAAPREHPRATCSASS